MGGYSQKARRFGVVTPQCRDLLRERIIWRPFMPFSLTLTVNGEKRNIELDDPRVTLLDLLRERLDLTGAKKGCDRGQCGACTILAMESALIPAWLWRRATTAPSCLRSRESPNATASIPYKPPSSRTTVSNADSARRARS